MPNRRFYHGVREAFGVGDEVLPRDGYCFFAPNLDAAIWSAELSDGEEEPRVYEVAVTGSMEDAAGLPGFTPLPHPFMAWRTPGSLTVLAEVTEWTCYHGTRADLTVGDLIKPGHAANFGPAPRTSNFVYFARTVDAAVWGAELAAGDRPGRVYLVEPTGEVEDDPNLTNARFKGNPTKSFRSRAPLRVVGELECWEGHPPELVRARRERLAQLEREGVVPDDG